MATFGVGNTILTPEQETDGVIPFQTKRDLYLHGPKTDNAYGTCSRCDLDNHVCPGCGENLNHGTEVCGRCYDEVQLSR